jgi:hypothetical protein
MFIYWKVSTRIKLDEFLMSYELMDFDLDHYYSLSLAHTVDSYLPPKTSISPLD